MWEKGQAKFNTFMQIIGLKTLRVYASLTAFWNVQQLTSNLARLHQLWCQYVDTKRNNDWFLRQKP
jgi:hypothetical protein